MDDKQSQQPNTIGQLGGKGASRNRPERRYLTVEQASEYIGRSPKAVYALIYRHVLPAIRVDGRVQVDRREIDRLMEINRS